MVQRVRQLLLGQAEIRNLFLFPFRSFFFRHQKISYDNVGFQLKMPNPSRVNKNDKVARFERIISLLGTVLE